MNTTLPPSFLHRDLVFCGSVFPFLHKNWINLPEAAAQQKCRCLLRKSFLCTSCTSGIRAEIFPLPVKGQREAPFDLSDFLQPWYGRCHCTDPPAGHFSTMAETRAAPGGEVRAGPRVFPFPCCILTPRLWAEVDGVSLPYSGLLSALGPKCGL